MSRRASVGLVFLLSTLHVIAAQSWWSSSYCGNNGTYRFLFGRRNYRDRLLYTNLTYQPSSFWGRAVADVEFPERGGWPRGTISYIEAVDQRRGGSCAELKAGGPGFHFAKIRLTSLWNRPLHFLINVFG